MYTLETHTKKFNTDLPEDMAEYDEILNDPLCSIISEKREKLVEKNFDDEGKLSNITERLIMVVTWTRKMLS
jgi:hypothetical protein